MSSKTWIDVIEHKAATTVVMTTSWTGTPYRYSASTFFCFLDWTVIKLFFWWMSALWHQNEFSSWFFTFYGTAVFPSLILGWWIRTSGREAVTMEINRNGLIIIILNSKNNESHQAELRFSLPLTIQNKLASALRSVRSVPAWFLFVTANFTWKHHSAFLSLPCLIDILNSSWWVLSPVCVLLCFIKLWNVSAWVICHSTEKSVGEETQPTPRKRYSLASSAFTQLTAGNHYSFIMQLFFFFFFYILNQGGFWPSMQAFFFRLISSLEFSYLLVSFLLMLATGLASLRLRWGKCVVFSAPL